MHRHYRYITACLVIALYVLINLGALAPLAFRSQAYAHAVAGECSGDCSICGCSPERSANHTCCCWQKKLPSHHHDDDDIPDCCKKIHDEEQPLTTITGQAPCRSGKFLAWTGVQQIDALPGPLYLLTPVIIESALVPSPPPIPTEWSPSPPEPPPKLLSIS